jgi:hypothetical protein
MEPGEGAVKADCDGRADPCSPLVCANIANSIGLDAGSARSRPILTSLPLQIFIYFGGWWDVLFWVLSILVFIYKGAEQAEAAENV